MKHFGLRGRGHPGLAVVTIDCPWCGWPIRISPPRLARMAELACPDCGTATLLADEPAQRAGRALSPAA